MLSPGSTNTASEAILGVSCCGKLVVEVIVKGEFSMRQPQTASQR